MAAVEGKEDDPFTRRKCQPTLVTLVNKKYDAFTTVIVHSVLIPSHRL